MPIKSRKSTSRSTQILFIHGGMTFKSRRDYLTFLKTKEIRLEKSINWSSNYLDKKLGSKFTVIHLRMPLSENAHYSDWKIIFERYLSKLNNNLILIGVSLGGIFLAKYLSENRVSKKIKSVYLIAPPFDNSLPGEDLLGGFHLKSDLSLIVKNCSDINLFFSVDDNIVPPSEALKYAKRLVSASILILDNMEGHFRTSKFPEIVKMIREKN